jgi:hypothetical protein
MITSDQYKIGTPEWKYARELEERRGHNYQYPSDKEYERLIESGYEFHIFNNKTYSDNQTRCEMSAKELVNEYKSKGYYSRIICFKQGKIPMREYCVIYKKKKNKECLKCMMYL